MGIKDNLKNWFLYCGTTKDRFDRISNELRDSNRKNLQVLTVITMIAMAGLAAASFFNSMLVKNRIMYFITFGISLLLFGLASLKKKSYVLVYTSVYIFLAGLLGFGLVLGTVINPDKLTVSFAVLLFALPLLFTDRPARMDIVLLAGMGAYSFMAHMNQSREIFVSNLLNIVPFGIISLLTSAYMMKIKAERMFLTIENKYLSEYDQMTDLYNRRSFDKITAEYISGVRSGRYCICIFDVNSLKATNDTYGHEAGDELIKGAASCIKNVLGRYGTCYRIGGDEFAALLDGDFPDADSIREMLSTGISSWKGKLVSELTLSMGIVSSDKHEEFNDVFQRADKMMYTDKSEYYRSRGIDRRSSLRK